VLKYFLPVLLRSLLWGSSTLDLLPQAPPNLHMPIEKAAVGKHPTTRLRCMLCHSQETPGGHCQKLTGLYLLFRTRHTCLILRALTCQSHGGQQHEPNLSQLAVSDEGVLRVPELQIIC
jgi:hypothetical protein